MWPSGALARLRARRHDAVAARCAQVVADVESDLAPSSAAKPPPRAPHATRARDMYARAADLARDGKLRAARRTARHGLMSLRNHVAFADADDDACMRDATLRHARRAARPWWYGRW